MNLNNATRKNVKWSFIESISLKIVGFVLSIILARLLLPSDFGVLAIVNVFYLMTTLFIDGGLREAIIQKKDADEKDFSTVFWLNISISVFLYLLLFISSPFIEDFYKFKDLSFFIRLQSLTLIIEAFGLIQIVKATKELNLKKITLARIPATIISFFVGIGLAYYGYGILSLIIQQLVSVGLYTLLLIYNIRYKPSLIISKASIKTLYGFGLKLFAVSFINRMYVQSLNLIYAFFFNVKELGFYTKSKSLQGVPIEIINNTFARGLYPTMVKVQQHNRLLRKIFLLNIRRLTFIMLIINCVFYFNAKEIVQFLLGENWIEMTDFLKIAAVGSIFYPLVSKVVNVFKVKGKANFLLKIELIWKITSVILIVILSMFTNFIFVLWTIVILNFIMGFVYLYFCSREIVFDFKKETILVLKMLIMFFFFGFILNYGLSMLFKNSFYLIKPIVFSIPYLIFIYIVNQRFGYFNLKKKLL
ncbi:lipopolysaccharide biosynthesis protein [Flavobacterium azooxidireducens]|uniref:Lipopolysaccharide biosynthesis protein n=1 Tax=Flavobacterium azooxidireducens TaxID=1871076 RepID=A0ABY4KF17_9FLAO|nr:lipopolysaccharide biosynthesis protein [Flavobacterium azooxidireducens]UPQ79294.1 lipopolysaccharide biosynthesis protein [Flavobacterium azooxidireducens]